MWESSQPLIHMAGAHSLGHRQTHTAAVTQATGGRHGRLDTLRDPHAGVLAQAGSPQDRERHAARAGPTGWRPPGWAHSVLGCLPRVPSGLPSLRDGQLSTLSSQQRQLCADSPPDRVGLRPQQLQRPQNTSHAGFSWPRGCHPADVNLQLAEAAKQGRRDPCGWAQTQEIVGVK